MSGSFGRIHARPGRYASGMGIGVILVDDVYPAFPGDVRNASGYGFPIQYEVAVGVSIAELVQGTQKDRLLEPIVAAAQRLERMGSRAIVAECGYFAWFQRELADAVHVPVFASSLLQIPLAQLTIRSDQVVGVLVADGDSLEDRHLSAVGVTLGSNYVVEGVQNGGRTPQFDSLWVDSLRPAVPTADYDLAERDFVRVAREFADRTPHLGAVVLECTGFPPFAQAVQRAIDLPVYSWSTLLELAFSVGVHRGFTGHV